MIQRLKNRGNEIYYITARSNDYVDNITDAYQLDSALKRLIEQ